MLEQGLQDIYNKLSKFIKLETNNRVNVKKIEFIKNENNSVFILIKNYEEFKERKGEKRYYFSTNSQKNWQYMKSQNIS